VGAFTIRPLLRPRTGCAVFLTGTGRGLRLCDPKHCWPANRKSWETNRNPLLLFELFLLRLATRAMRPFAQAIGVGVGDEGPFEDWLDDIA
jgi:hypothetical protein